MPQPRRNPAHAAALAGAALFLSFFCLYVGTHCGSIYLDDSGETVTDAAVLGVAHPPGYPLHTLLTRLSLLAARMVGGLGGPAEPVTLLAALFGALGVALLFFILLPAPEPGEGAPSGAMALAAAALPAVALGLGPVFWHNALTAKGGIYQLNNLLSLGLLGLLAPPGPAGPRRLRLFWLLLGLALAHHYMSQLPLLPAYAVLLADRARPGRRWRDAWMLLPGLALYLYLPLRSALQPRLNWGGIHDLGGLLFCVLRLQYATTDISRSVGTSWAELRYALGLMLREGAWVLTPLALAGLWIGRREAAPKAWAAGILATLAACSLYMNLKPDRLTLLHPYLFPAYLCQALLAGRALAPAARLLRSRAARAAALALTALACAAYARAEAPSLDLSGYTLALDMARAELETLPKNALLLAQGDAVVFPLWYTQRVLGVRPDVAVVGLAVLPMEWVRHDVERHWPDVRFPETGRPLGAESVGPLTQATLDENVQRPAFATFDRFGPKVTGWRLVPYGPDYWCVPLAFGPPKSRTDSPAQRAAALARLGAVPLRGALRRPVDAATSRYLLGDFAIRYNELGVAAENAGSYAEARRDYATAAEIKPEDPVFPFNLGNADYELGDYLSAEADFRRALQADPGYVNAWYNLGATQLRVGDLKDARESLTRARDLAPGRADIRLALQRAGVNSWPGGPGGTP